MEYKINKPPKREFSKIIINIIAGLLLIAAGYSISKILEGFNKPKPVITLPALPATKTMSETSVSINERGELLIIDRNTGEYEIFEDSIGMAIFTLYARDIEAKYENK